jgi:hypothetical protein
VPEADAAGDVFAAAAPGPWPVSWMEFSLSGDTASVAEPADLVGRLVTFIVDNGACVVAVRVLGITDRLIYRLPQCAGDSAVELRHIGHLHLYPREAEQRVQADPAGNVYLGETVPYQAPPPPRALRR